MANKLTAFHLPPQLFYCEKLEDTKISILRIIGDNHLEYLKFNRLKYGKQFDIFMNEALNNKENDALKNKNDGQREKILFVALRSSSENMIRYLLNNYQVDLTATNDRDQTYFMHCLLSIVV